MFLRKIGFYPCFNINNTYKNLFFCIANCTYFPVDIDKFSLVFLIEGDKLIVQAYFLILEFLDL